MQNWKLPIREYVFTAGTGGALYAYLEILWRGYTHWSMILAGALSALFLYQIQKNMTTVPFLLRCLLGTAAITAVEFFTGCVVNLWWGLDVWDYSDLPYNLWGQICPAFCAMWFFLCIPAFWLCRQIRRLCLHLDSSPAPEHTDQTEKAAG